MISIKKQLTVWLIGFLAVFGLLAGLISYVLAEESARVFLDHQLLLVAGSVDEGSQLPKMQAKFLGESKQEQLDDFVIQVWNENGPIRSSRPNFNLPKGNITGYSDMLTSGEKWRVYTIIYPDRTVQTSQSEKVRSEFATDAALYALLPILGLLPLSWILAIGGVAHILKPLADVAEAVTQRDASSLAPLPSEHIPKEITPLVKEMNGLLLRIRESIESQRHFVLDAAHELRTPLAALQLQIENLSQSRSQIDFEDRVDELKSGMQRASHLVGQLLKMARYEAEYQTVNAKIDLGEVVKKCIGNFIPFAEKRGIDLGMTLDEAASICANPDDLRVLFDNLLDNAIRYTPEAGKIDVSIVLSGKKAVVKIVDDGPGIPEALLPRVFDRFFRVGGDETEGSGIGLAIVSAIATRESAEVKISNRQERQGLIVEVSFNPEVSSKTISC